MPARDQPLRAAHPPVRRSHLAADLRRIGVREGSILMVHASISRLGWVVGGSQTVVQALQDAVGPEGTLLAYAGWEDNPFHLAEWPADWQDAYRREMPPFDPAIAEARQSGGRLPERIRTWPGARRSDHPEAGFVALGARAGWVTADQDRVEPYGRRSPLGRLVESEGQVLLLGTPMTTITLLHHAEAIVALPGKQRVQYELPVRRGEEVAWETFSDISTDADTGRGALPYDRVLGGDLADSVHEVVREAGLGRFGTVGRADCWLVDAPDFVAFAVSWLTAHFG